MYLVLKVNCKWITTDLANNVYATDLLQVYFITSKGYRRNCYINLFVMHDVSLREDNYNVDLNFILLLEQLFL